MKYVRLEPFYNIRSAKYKGQNTKNMNVVMLYLSESKAFDDEVPIIQPTFLAFATLPLRIC